MMKDELRFPVCASVGGNKSQARCSEDDGQIRRREPWAIPDRTRHDRLVKGRFGDIQKMDETGIGRNWLTNTGEPCASLTSKPGR